MNSISQDPEDEANKQDNVSVPHAGQSHIQSNWLGQFSLLRSPLFFAVTMLIVVITALVARYTQNLELSILSGMVIELLALVVIWQYLLLSRRLEDISHRVSDLQSFTESAGQRFSSLRASHGYTHRLLGEMSGDQSRILQSIEELKRALKLIYDHIEIFCNHIEHWQSQNLEHFGEIKQSLATLESETIAEWQNRNLEHFGEITQSLATLESETIAEWQNRNLEHFGEITQSLATLESETIAGWQNRNLEHFGEITQSLATLKAETVDELGLKLKNLRDSNQRAVSEVHKGLADLVRNTEERQQQSLELFVNEQITSLPKRIIAAQTKLEASMAVHVKKSIKELRENLTADLPEKTAFAVDERLLAQSQKVSAALTELDGQIGHLNDHLSAVEGEMSSLADRESNISKALEVSTALDRLNLEVRRQLAELRTELNNR